MSTGRCLLVWFVVVSRVHSKLPPGVGVLLTYNMWHIRLFPTPIMIGSLIHWTEAISSMCFMQHMLIYEPVERNLLSWFITFEFSFWSLEFVSWMFSCKCWLSLHPFIYVRLAGITCKCANCAGHVQAMVGPVHVISSSGWWNIGLCLFIWSTAEKFISSPPCSSSSPWVWSQPEEAENKSGCPCFWMSSSWL